MHDLPQDRSLLSRGGRDRFRRSAQNGQARVAGAQRGGNNQPAFHQGLQALHPVIGARELPGREAIALKNLERVWELVGDKEQFTRTCKTK